MSTFNPTETPGIYAEDPPIGGPRGFIDLHTPIGIDDQFGFILRAVNDSDVTLTNIVYHFTIAATSSGAGVAMPNGPSGVSSTLSGVNTGTNTATGLALSLSGHTLEPGATVRIVVADWVARVAAGTTLSFWLENAESQDVPQYGTTMTITT